ncbi:MAG: bifunctional riboflavin kinase/FAD synthetase [Nocardioidaceae bacterium]
MRVWHDLTQIDPSLGPSVVTIGNFDGVHLGHRHVIDRARGLAAERGGLPVVAITFDPHPMKVIRPDKAPQPLTSVDARVALLGEAGVDAVLVLNFTSALADLAAEDFANHIVFEALHANAVVVGENFRFGHRALGDVEMLTKLGSDRGVTVAGLPLDGTGGHAWSSTYIRRQIAAGQVAAAARALARPFAIRGVVVVGEQRGRELGFPTANVPVTTMRTAVPADGVYAGWLRRLDQAGAPYWPAAISVGTNPTFQGIDRLVEAYALDRTDLELYGVEVETLFVERLRRMVRFGSIDDLVAQMTDDVEKARALLVDRRLCS